MAKDKNNLDANFLNNLIKNVKEEGRSKGLTGNQLDKRKNFHWDIVYKWLSRIFIGTIAWFCISFVILSIIYFIILYKIPEDFKRIYENIIYTAFVSIATLGIRNVIDSFLKRKS